MKASEKNWELARRFWARGIEQVERDHAETLRKAELTLHRWHELECGADNGRGSTVIVERDDEGNPYTVVHSGVRTYRYRRPDHEKGAIHRVADVCAALGLHYYVQGDPRGCALYVSNEPLTDQNYSNGIPCCM